MQAPRQLTGATCFSGIGASETAAPWINWRWSAEVEAFPAEVLAHRYPHSANLGDVTAEDFIARARTLGPIDVLAGGPPCQAFSVAGLRQSLDDARGNLSLQWVRIIHAIDPTWSLTENVPGWLTTKDNAFGCFLGALVGAGDALHSGRDGGKWPGQGMVAGPKGRAAWIIRDAQYFGVPQRRRRVFVVASSRDWADPAAVLFEREGVRRHPAPGRQAREGIAHTLTGGARRSGWSADEIPLIERRVADTLIAHTLRGEGFDASEDGTGRGIPLIAFDCKAATPNAGGEIAPTLRAMNDNGRPNGGGQVAVAAYFSPRATRSTEHTENQVGIKTAPPIRSDCLETNGPGSIAYGFQPRIARNGRGDMGDTADALTAHAGGTGKGDSAPCVAIGFSAEDEGADASGGIMGSLRTGVRHGVAYANDNPPPAMLVRRLTPTECERLQGFPDRHTAIVRASGKPAADGNRYKACGNSMAVPVIAWILERIALATAAEPANDNPAPLAIAA